jgi:hypothetical protein
MTLRIHQLFKRFETTPVFTNVSLNVKSGEFVAILSKSGVSKSILLNSMVALDQWDSGTVHLDGIDLGGLAEDARAAQHRKKVGFIFQAFHMLPHLDVAQNVGLPLLLLGAPDNARVRAMLDAVGLSRPIDFFIIHDNQSLSHAIYPEQIVWRYEAWQDKRWTRQQRSGSELDGCCKKARRQHKLHWMWVWRGKPCIDGKRYSMRAELRPCAQYLCGAAQPSLARHNARSCAVPSCKIPTSMALAPNYGPS